MDDEIVRLRTLCEQMTFEPAEEHSLMGTVYKDGAQTCPESVFVHPAILPGGKKSSFSRLCLLQPVSGTVTTALSGPGVISIAPLFAPKNLPDYLSSYP